MAVCILPAGPKLPCRASRPRLKYGLLSAVAPHTAVTRSDRAGQTISRVGNPSLMLFPAAANLATPASYAALTACAQRRVGAPPMLIEITQAPDATAYSIPSAIELLKKCTTESAIRIGTTSA